MGSRRTLTVFLLSALMLQGTTLEMNREGTHQKRAVNMNAFSTDFSQCLFKFWTDVDNKENLVLDIPVKCSEEYLIQLCYGANHRRAQFVVCYNTRTLIPEFTGHELQPQIEESGDRDGGFRDDPGVDPVAKDEDYAACQDTVLENDNQQLEHYCSRGHLTPNADFADPDEREFTMVTTNIAPQWQAFKNGNWAALERLMRRFASQENHVLYVLTGTSGTAKNQTGEDIKLNGRVLAPKYFWKAVCDPVNSQSAFFYARNPTSNTMADKSEFGCGAVQTERYGVVKCNSIVDGVAELEKEVPGAADDIPAFNLKTCTPDSLGELFTTYLKDHVNNWH